LFQANYHYYTKKLLSCNTISPIIIIRVQHYLLFIGLLTTGYWQLTMLFDPNLHPHRRYNPLTGDTVFVAPQRLQRPWGGREERKGTAALPAYDPNCYLCPGNMRAGGQRNPDYSTTYVFPNDFPSLINAESGVRSAELDVPLTAKSLLRAAPVHGECRVFCFSPRHDLTLPQMALPQIRGVVDVWAEQTAELGWLYRWVQIFENKGAIMGCSNAHPHGQIWGMDALPHEAEKEDRRQRLYYEENGSPLLMDYAALELELGERVVIENEQWLVVVPYWAMWPFETLLLPRRHVQRLPELDDGERDALASILKRLLTRYDNLFETSFPYSMGWHGKPFWNAEFGAQSVESIPHSAFRTPHWTVHAHFYPPLLRSATVKKFMVGFEMLGEPVRDLTPEIAAARLRELPEEHYLD
jgi:UDPglucose--hexose-1-phosphate uridylyltransferase